MASADQCSSKGLAWFHSVGGSDSQLTTVPSLASKLVSMGAHLPKNDIQKGPLTHHVHTLCSHVVHAGNQSLDSPLVGVNTLLEPNIEVL